MFPTTMPTSPVISFLSYCSSLIGLFFFFFNRYFHCGSPSQSFSGNPLSVEARPLHPATQNLTVASNLIKIKANLSKGPPVPHQLGPFPL